MFLYDHPQKQHVTLFDISRWSLLQSTLSETDSFGPEFPGVCFKDRGFHLIEVSVKRVLCVDEQLTRSSFKDGKSISSQKFTEKWGKIEVVGYRLDQKELAGGHTM